MAELLRSVQALQGGAGAGSRKRKFKAPAAPAAGDEASEDGTSDGGASPCAQKKRRAVLISGVFKPAAVFQAFEGEDFSAILELLRKWLGTPGAPSLADQVRPHLPRHLDAVSRGGPVPEGFDAALAANLLLRLAGSRLRRSAVLLDASSRPGRFHTYADRLAAEIRSGSANGREALLLLREAVAGEQPLGVPVPAPARARANSPAPAAHAFSDAASGPQSEAPAPAESDPDSGDSDPDSADSDPARPGPSRPLHEVRADDIAAGLRDLQDRLRALRARAPALALDVHALGGFRLPTEDELRKLAPARLLRDADGLLANLRLLRELAEALGAFLDEREARRREAVRQLEAARQEHEAAEALRREALERNRRAEQDIRDAQALLDAHRAAARAAVEAGDFAEVARFGALAGDAQAALRDAEGRAAVLLAELPMPMPRPVSPPALEPVRRAQALDFYRNRLADRPEPHRRDALVAAILALPPASPSPSLAETNHTGY